MPDEAPASPPGEQLSLEARLAALESAVASLGAIQVTQNHDSLARFRAWLASYLVRL